MTAPAAESRPANGRDITETSVLRIGRTDYPVTSLYVTPSGCRVTQLEGEQAPRVFCADDIVTLVLANETTSPGALKARTA